MSEGQQGCNEGCVGPSAPDAGKNSRCAGCPSQARCASGQGAQPDPDIDQIKARFSTIKHVILILSGKGGVGKSTVATQLAFTLANSGKLVGLLDLDLCGPSIPRMSGVRGQSVRTSTTGWLPVYAEDNLNVMSIGFLLGSEDDAVIWRGPKKNSLIKQFLIEVEWAPPGTSDEHISIAQYLQHVQSLHGILVTTPQEVSMMDVRKEINFCIKSKINMLGIIENMSNLESKINDLKFLNNNNEDVSNDVRNIIQSTFPELLMYKISSDIFIKYGDGPMGMAKKFGINYLGRIPLVPGLLLACEDGYSYVVREPEGCAAASLMAISSGIIKLIEGH